MMQDIQVVSAEEMAHIETGGDFEHFMLEAGKKIAEVAESYIKAHGLSKQITLLVGKGNNGGDAYAAGLFLLERGYRVHAYPLYDDVTPLHRKMR